MTWRVLAFARDLWEQIQASWSVCVMWDCERNGGHRFGAPEPSSLGGSWRVCGRCGCSQSTSDNGLTTEARV